LPKPNGHGGHEVFKFLGRKWDIGKALQVLKDSPRETIPFPAHRWWGWLIDPEDPKKDTRKGIEAKAASLCAITVDWNHVKQVTGERMEDPVILGSFKAKQDGTKYGIVLDGWHRIAKSKREGIQNLRAYVLTEEETARVEI
jgi:hypothetical protein